MYHFANLAEVEKALRQFWPSQTPRTAYTLEHVTAFMTYLGDPQDTIRAIHIAGTSGKTSSAYYAAALLQTTGKKIGLLTSPHVELLTERVQVNLEPMTEQLFCQELATFMNQIEQSGITLTYAEILYAFAYWEFARQQVDYMVIEVGLGGLLDATNVMTRQDKVCVITDISLDHTNVLGTTLPEVAEQKAGIIGPHNTVFSYQQDPQIMDAITTACRQREASLRTITTAPSASLDWLPLFQQRNFALVREAVDYVIGRDQLPGLGSNALQTAAHTFIPGRMETHRHGDQTVILDGAHNPQKLATLRASLSAAFTDQPIVVLVSFIKGGGRDLIAMLRELTSLCTHVILAAPAQDGHDWYTAQELQKAARAAGLSSFEVIAVYDEALAAFIRRPEPVLVATGSLYALAYVRHFLTSQH